MSTLNTQIVDGVVQLDELAVSSSASSSQGMLDAVMAETIGMLMHNAVSGQHNAQMVGTAAVTAVCAQMLRLPSPQLPPPMPIKNGGPKGPVPSGPDDIARAAVQAEDGIETMARQQESARENSAEIAKRLGDLTALAAAVVQENPGDRPGAGE